MAKRKESGGSEGQRAQRLSRRPGRRSGRSKPADRSDPFPAARFDRAANSRRRRSWAAGLPHERRYLTREEFARRHGARASDIEKVRAFAKQHDLAVVTEDRARRTVKLSGTIEAFTAAFGVSLRRYEHPTGTYRCRTGSLPGFPHRPQIDCGGCFRPR